MLVLVGGVQKQPKLEKFVAKIVPRDLEERRSWDLEGRHHGTLRGGAGTSRVGLHKLWQPGNGERMRKWREIHPLFSLYFLPLYQFPISKLLSQNVKYGTFVANVTKN